jgi:hypothetical protein
VRMNREMVEEWLAQSLTLEFLKLLSQKRQHLWTQSVLRETADSIVIEAARKEGRIEELSYILDGTWQGELIEDSP